MTTRRGAVAALGVLIGGGQIAWAAEPWGTPAEAAVCEKDYAAHKKWKRHVPAINEALQHGEVSAPCQAEIEKRGSQCSSDPEMQKIINDPAYKITDAAAWCRYRAFWNMANQLDVVLEAQQKDAAAAQKAATEKARVEAVVMPKPAGHVPAIEKMVASSYSKIYPDRTLLKVVLDGATEWQIKRSFVGIITGRSIWATIASQKGDKCQVYGTYWEQQHNGKAFSGSLVEHGAGAATYSEILCSKVK
jgi:hypothetical protein